jgi:hypothetical protein
LSGLVQLLEHLRVVSYVEAMNMLARTCSLREVACHPGGYVIPCRECPMYRVGGVRCGTKRQRQVAAVIRPGRLADTLLRVLALRTGGAPRTASVAEPPREFVARQRD